MEFGILNVSRAAEILGAHWPKIDLEARLWVIPADRMKAGREHRVPLTDAAIAILHGMKAKRISRHGDWLFPGAKARGRLAQATFFNLLQDMGRTDVVPHGFRTTFRTWYQDHAKPDDLAEAAQAHVKGSATGRAYARSDMLERRRELMQQWSDFCAGRWPQSGTITEG